MLMWQKGCGTSKALKDASSDEKEEVESNGACVW
jgi:hypothetical protein